MYVADSAAEKYDHCAYEKLVEELPVAVDSWPYLCGDGYLAWHDNVR